MEAYLGRYKIVGSVASLLYAQFVIIYKRREVSPLLWRVGSGYRRSDIGNQNSRGL